MRPTRLLVTLSLSIVTITLLLFLTPSHHSADAVPSPLSSAKKKSRLRALLSFRAPLFPPSAIISLTDDNSTFFLARPAAFGPSLPGSGLSGQLWIGSGFGEDNLGRGGKSEGELGCSDVPGWDESWDQPKPKDGASDASVESGAKHAGHQSAKNKKKTNKHSKRDEDIQDAVDAEDRDTSNLVIATKEDDGTDNNLYRPASELTLLDGSRKGPLEQHADIQSLQESAEIAGKVVLLSRGGCGFLDKVKWVQRRGGMALIVGDDVRGGPLVTMYAKGDTSNVTIAALFTSYTTAHLLSSLIPSGGAFGVLPSHLGNIDKVGTSKHDPEKPKAQDNAPTFTQAVAKPKATADHKLLKQSDGEGSSAVKEEEQKSHNSWLRRLMTWIGLASSRDPDVHRRPPGSGNLDWKQVEEFDADASGLAKGSEEADIQASGDTPVDNFVIGVHDWRDPDLLPAADSHEVEPRKVVKVHHQSSDSKPNGGIVQPGSGEYEKSSNVGAEHKLEHSSGTPLKHSAESWFGHLQWNHKNPKHEETDNSDVQSCDGPTCGQDFKSKGVIGSKGRDFNIPKHEGLWVTLSPTNMSSSPFFDTLLVLVVSPLVTLTVVYALLLLRSRIRRRRWRAPKSVVERLPVRTYRTISSEASTTSIATPNASSPTTPLLMPAPRRVGSRSSSRPRPRSRTASEVPEQGASSSLLGEHFVSPSAAEKRESGLAEWKRKYGGRQKECVVCLEEYVDGVSRVMSLPCGHEFHVECITPWLTTRRRTCPICKGDVVRSMQRASANVVSTSTSLSRTNSFHDDDDEVSSVQRRSQSQSQQYRHQNEDVQDLAATTRNDDPHADMPIEDLESGVDQSASSEEQSWAGWAGTLFGGRGGRGRTRRRTGEDDENEPIPDRNR